MVRREYCFGIYKYVDKETGNIVYIGKDSHIDKKARGNEHMYPSTYNDQQINRVLQNNPNRYDYVVWYHVDSIEELNQLEYDLINLYRPRFNYCLGGGAPIVKEFCYTVVKAGKTRQGKQEYKISKSDNLPLIFSLDKKFLEDICVKLNDGKMSLDDVKEIKNNRSHLLKTKLEQSRKNITGFFRVNKMKDKSSARGFIWRYEYWDNGKKKKFARVNLFDLKKEVEERGLPWKIIDIDKAIQTVRSIHTGF